ncbi:MAG: hypothetical protein JW833_16470 [Prolixibacteraceae bacterium]|nr:hypothetical protein [Prolixibacteraceae bacterium]
MKELSIEHFEDYKKQMELGILPEVYKGLIEYMMSLRTYFKSNFPEYLVGSFYQGYMDMTYFPVVPISLKNSNLKFAVVFDHLKIRFEIWLSGKNRKIQKEYQNLLKQKELDKNYIFTENPDSIIEMVVVENPDFNDLNSITTEIERGIEKFVKDVSDVLK